MFSKKANSDKLILTPLIPKSNVNLGVYKDALDSIFSNNEVRNIALSGSYGAGKSSIIKTYEKHKNKKFLYISLAHFVPYDDEKNNDPNMIKSDTPKISILEWKILNQLIHQINPNSIPQTNFRIKRSLTKLGEFGLVKATTLVLVFISSLLHVILFNRWINFYNTFTANFLKCVLYFTTYPGFRLIALIISLVLVWYGLFKLLVLQREQRIIKKLDVKGAVIEMFNGSDESYFDKYLNEVLYLFSNTEQDVIVFEDMDRFNSNVIFERLREVNILINNSRQTKNNPMRFFYLIRDDIFINKDRTKFFDLIIPVVPVVDGSNSYDKFIDVFREHNILEHFDSAFLQGFSLYIDEMRLLLNICNEYQVYYHQIGKTGTEIELNKMLAIIAFKNLFPKEFADLQLGQGFVFTLMSSKDEIIRKEQERIKNKIYELKTKTENAKNEHLQSETEVNLVYEKELESLNNRLHYANTSERQQIMKKINEINQLILSRKEAIRCKEKDVNADLLSQISKLENQISEYNGKRIKDLLPQETIESIFSSNKYISPIGNTDNFDNVKSSQYFPLLIFLVRNGYIDETYKDYMTYFYPNSLSARDAAFCRSITDRNAKSPNYSIDNPAMIVNRLPPEYFKQTEVLNYSLLDYLLVEKNPSKQLTLIFQQIKSIKLYNFIHGYFASGKELNKFIISINSVWSTLFSELQKYKALDHKALYRFVSCTFYGSTDEILLTVNVDKCLTNFISNSTIFLWDNNRQSEFVIDRLKMLKVLFVAIDKEKANSDLLQGVYENNLYKITFENISIMLQKYYNMKTSLDFIHRNYTLILSNKNSPLAVYVNNNIEEYINEILKNCNKQITDDEEIILLILNNEKINVDLKKEYISLLKTQLTELVKIKDNTLWKHILNNNDAIFYSEKNVIDYFLNNNYIFDDDLINWINKQTKKLDFSKDALMNNENNERDKYLDAIVQCNKLNDDKYSEFTATIRRVYVVFSLDNIEKNKMFILIDKNIIKMNIENLEFIRNNYSIEVFCHYIICNIDEYIKILETQKNLLKTDELEYIISSKKNVSEDNQIKLLNTANNALSIIGKSYSEKIKLHILLHNFLENDYEILIKSYDDYSGEIKKAIVDLFINRAEKTIESKYPISKSLFDDLANSEKLDEEKIKFILPLVSTVSTN
jgi:hypothetical protein